MEDVDHVLVEDVADVVGEALEFLLDRTEAFEGEGAVLLLVDRGIGAHCPVLQICNKGSSCVDDKGLTLFDLGELNIVKHLFIGGAHDRGLTMIRLDTSNAAVKVDQNGVGGRERKSGLTKSGGSVDNHRELLVVKGHFSRLLNHCVFPFFFKKYF